jgi:ubiquinone/menaquinone biosynthesis C-methylase UbiE
VTTNERSSSQTRAIGDVYASREVAEAFRTGAADRDQSLGPATELMLDLADVRVGSRVLDVGAGTGDQTLVAARRVGPTGYVLATDVHASMLGVAADRSRHAGLGHVETRVMDAQRLESEPDPFDAVISRLTLMLLPDPRAALIGIRHALKPNGKLAAIVYSAPDRNPMPWLAQEVARRRGLLPAFAPDRPGMFALGSPGTFQAMLRQAGFREVTVRAAAAPRPFPSAAAAVRYLRESTPMLREALANLPDPERMDVWAEVEQELRQFEVGDAFTAPGEVLVGAGTK